MKTHYLKSVLFENLVTLELLQWMEIKSARTFAHDFLNTFRFPDKNEDAGKDNRSIIYGGDDTFIHKGCNIVSWRDLRRFEK